MKRDIIVILLAIVLVFAFNEGIKIATGTEVPIAIVEGSSMIPTFYDGDVILVVGVKPSDLNVGDVIIYKTYNDRMIVHRIVDIVINDGMYFFKTQGDNNPLPDPGLVSEAQVVGRVVGVLLPKVGGLFKFIMPYKYVVVGLLLVLAVILIMLPPNKNKSIDKKK
ncbi:MAG: signal peptidase I [Candidatus Nezhaarchaeales archaeon]